VQTSVNASVTESLEDGVGLITFGEIE